MQIIFRVAQKICLIILAPAVWMGGLVLVGVDVLLRKKLEEVLKWRV